MNRLDFRSVPIRAQPEPNGRLVVSLAWKEPPSSPVVFEQVIERGRAMREAGFAARAVFGLVDTDRSLTANFGEDVTLVTASGAGSLVMLVRRMMASAGTDCERSPILICRGAFVAVAALTARKISGADWVIVHDARGWYAREGIEKKDGLAARQGKPLIERFAFRRSDYNVVVSEALLGIALSLGANPASTRVIPPYTRLAGTSAEPPPDPADVLYVGDSRHPYQSEALVAPLLQSLASAKPETTFGWLDNAGPAEPEAIAANLWRRRIPHDQVESYLHRALVGLVIREPTVTNGVAFPTKALQYLTAGCAVVTTPYPPAIGEICRVTGSGRVVQSFEPEAWAQAVTELINHHPRRPLEFGSSVAASWTELLCAI
jgi:Glycosyl transferases group 1